MRTATIRVYTFEELSAQAKEKAREWYKGEMNEDFTAEADMITDTMLDYIKNEGGAGESISDLKVSWSLSCCQGDGASFTGTVYGYDDNALVLFNHIYNNNIPKNVKRILHGINIKFTRKSSWYCHRYTVDTEIEIDGMYVGNIDRVEKIVEDIEKVVETWRYALCDNLENLGYGEIDYYYSNEYIDENIIMNGYEFTVEGDRY